MMNSLKILVKRVLQGEETVKLVESSIVEKKTFALVVEKAPADGFMVGVEELFDGFLFIRDSDLELAKKARDERNKMVSVEAQSWRIKLP